MKEKLLVDRRLSVALSSIKLKLIVLGILLLFIMPFANAQRIASVSGPWESTITWGGASIPALTDSVTIGDGISVDINSAAVCKSLRFYNQGNSSTVTINLSNSLTVAELITLSRPLNGSTYTLAVNEGTLTAGSVAIIGGPGPRVSQFTVSTGTAIITGNITGSGTGNSARIIITGSGVLNVEGDINTIRTINLGAGTLNVGGNLTGTTSFTPGTSIVDFNGVNQTVGAYTYYNLIFSGSGTKTTAAGTVTVNSDWTLTGGTAALNTNNTSVTVTGNITGSGNITSGTGTITCSGSWTNSGTFTKGTGTVIYNGNNTQTVAALSYNNLTLSGTGQKNAAAGTIEVSGDLTNSSVFDMSENTLILGATTTNTGTIRFSGITNGLAIGSGTVEYYGGDQTITQGTYTNLITSGSGVKTISAGSAVTVEGDLTTNDLLSIESTSISSSGSLIVNGISTGKVTYKRQLREESNLGDYHFTSSPVASNTESNAGRITEVWTWNEILGNWERLGSGFSAFESGKGYNIDITASSVGLLTFTGSLIADTIYVPVTSPYASGYNPRDTEYDYGLDNPDINIWTTGRNWDNYGGGGWNLLGNPFTSAMNVTNFLSENAGRFDPNYQAIYIYDRFTRTYSYIGSPIEGFPDSSGDFGFSQIQAGQGFFVLAYYDGISFMFVPGIGGFGMQFHDVAVPMTKSAKVKNSWPGLQLKVKYGSGESMTTVVYNENMTIGLDPGYDIGQLSNGPDVEIYTALVEKDHSVNFARQALPLADCNKNIIPVGIDSEKGGEVTFSAYTIPLDNNRFWLEDRVTGFFTDLTTKSYTVTIPSKTYGTGRFYIYASANTPTAIKPVPQDPGPDLRIWTSDGKVIIKGDVGDDAICAVFSVHGNRILETRLPDGELNTITLPSDSKGVFIVRVTDGVKMTTKKVVIL